MGKETNSKKYDLEERTLVFTKRVIQLVNAVPQTLANREIAKQLTRSAESVGANYIEANESLGKKDFLYHIRISRKEAKESRYWFQLLECPEALIPERISLIQEALELMRIFGAIVEKTRQKSISYQ